MRAFVQKAHIRCRGRGGDRLRRRGRRVVRRRERAVGQAGGGRQHASAGDVCCMRGDVRGVTRSGCRRHAAGARGKAQGRRQGPKIVLPCQIRLALAKKHYSQMPYRALSVATKPVPAAALEATAAQDIRLVAQGGIASDRFMTRLLFGRAYGRQHETVRKALPYFTLAESLRIWLACIEAGHGGRHRSDHGRRRPGRQAGGRRAQEACDACRAGKVQRRGRLGLRQPPPTRGGCQDLASIGTKFSMMITT